ncbi:hypothetical protein [Streptomyces sp. NPDC096030]|uniref:hypothetical protein n=1 Tax=Streptomyces sp. NPDC096030 TaxID=3155423 RepID=UPI00331C97C1
MQFIAHLDRGADGMCEEWDPVAGGNRAYVFPAEGLLPATAPAVGETRLDKVSVLVARPVEAETYGEEDTFGPVDGKEVLGQLGGQPYWRGMLAGGLPVAVLSA